MSETAAVGLGQLLPGLFPAATVKAPAESPFAQLLASLELPPEALPTEADAVSLAALAPPSGVFSLPASRRVLAPPGPPPPAAGPRQAVAPMLAAAGATPAAPAAGANPPAAGSTPPAVAEPTLPAPGTERPGLPSPPPGQAILAALPIREAGVPVPPPALSLARELASARPKPGASIAPAPETAGEQPVDSSEEPPGFRQSPARSIEAPATGLPAGPAARPTPAVTTPSVNPSIGAQTPGGVPAAEPPMVASESPQAPAASRPMDPSPLLAGPELGSQLGERVGWMLRSDVRSAEIRVFPRDLGHVRINLSIQPEGVEIEMQASSALLVEELHQAAPRLRALLSEQGLGLSHLEIDHQGPEGRRQGADGSRSKPETAAARGAEPPEEGSPRDDPEPVRIIVPRLVDVFA